VLVWLPEGVVTDTTERDAPPDVLSLLPSVDFDRAERNNSVHVVERVVGIGDLITVGGYATREVTPSGTGRGFRSPPTALVVSAIYEQPLIIASTSLVAKWCDPDR
jgi:hypothetical protein